MHHMFRFSKFEVWALPTGALWFPEVRLMCVSDLHLGKSERIARRGGTLLPPYESLATLDKLDADITTYAPETVICLGDSFDDIAAAEALDPQIVTRIFKMQAGRNWIWIEGNHDPGPVELGGTHIAEFQLESIVFRHIAVPDANYEISGHYHPKFRIPGRGTTRASFLYDRSRIILPAYGTYTGGLRASDPALSNLFQAPAIAVMTGRSALAVPYLV